MSRNLRIVSTVLLLHVGALWALQAGLLRRVAEVFVPAQVLVEMQTPSDPVATPQPTRAAVPTPAKAPLVPPTPPTPMAVATASTQPSALAPAPAAALTAATAGDKASSTATPSASSAATVPSTPRLELPSSDADYLNNPKPPYPPLSKRMGEQGKVVIRTLIGADGIAQDASIHQSSGFDRLDQAALATARRWRYVPGKRAGVAEAMWFNVPFNFVLE
jgi:protein TonB